MGANEKLNEVFEILEISNDDFYSITIDNNSIGLQGRFSSSLIRKINRKTQNAFEWIFEKQHCWIQCQITLENSIVKITLT